ncbi:SDR family oxidoreductase [Tundrisphaera sp. TA3]|uniref:SDR family oxidoreductase n=1 Tax=Tundrisphaera sp. TA3 TaxID=3435775 RepID=UPI003EBA9A94
MSQQKQEPEGPMPPEQQEGQGIEAEMGQKPRYQAPDYRAAGKLEGKVALITGGDSGIGRAVAVLYAREGADVAIVYLAEEQADAEETRGAVEAAGRRCLLLPGDVTDPQGCRNLVERTVKELGQLDILVNNAAYQMQQDRFEDITVEQFDKTFKTNIYGYFFMVKAALPHLKKGSSIINVGSIAGMRGTARLMDYSATKGAIHAFTKSLAQNFVDRGIRVNCVAPGPVWTPFIPMSEPAHQVAKHGEKTPMGRPAQPEEISPAFVFFASEADSSYITGEVLTLLGGEVTTG